jgi:Protein of unknown function (DUF4232)
MLLWVPVLLVGCQPQWVEHLPPRAGAFTTRCSTGQLTVGLVGGGFSEPTGQHTVPLLISNTSTNGCYLFGYPQVAFVDGAGHTIPFQIQSSGDQVVTSAQPGRVDLAPHGLAYVTLNKYRCDTGDVTQATAVRITPPGVSASLEVAISGIAYCGPGDPGSIVQVSPIAETQSGTLSH